jgi:hypothetical protein
MHRVSQGGGDPAAISIEVNESGPLDTIMALPTDREGGIGFLDVDRFGAAIAGQPCGELIGRVEQPSIAGFGREQNKLTDGDDAPIVAGCPTLNVTHFIGETRSTSVTWITRLPVGRQGFLYHIHTIPMREGSVCVRQYFLQYCGALL